MARRLLARELDRRAGCGARPRRRAQSRGPASSRSASARSSTPSSSSPPAPRRRSLRFEGLGEVDFWTNKEAVWAEAPPESLVVLGGGPVGVELAQFFHRWARRSRWSSPQSTCSRGSTTRRGSCSESASPRRASRSASRRAPSASRRRTPACASTSRTGDPARGRAAPRRHRAHAERPGHRARAARRRAHEEGHRRRRAACARPTACGRSATRPASRSSRTWASTRPASPPRTSPAATTCADYRAIPAAVFTDPQVASVGHDERRPCRDGQCTGSRAVGSRRTSARSGRALLKVAAAEGKAIVGAVAVGPEAGEWIGQLTLAVRARIPLETLLDTIQPYPTFSEAIFNASSASLGSRAASARYAA